MIMPTSIYDFSLNNIKGGTIDFKQFEGKKILIVNTASLCGYTPQYAQLQELYTLWQDKLVIVACPSNDFGNQEPADNEKIAQFCTTSYQITFPISEKIKVLGEQQHPLYRWFTTLTKQPIAWNFEKYLFDETGQFLKSFSPATSPIEEELLQAVGFAL